MINLKWNFKFFLDRVKVRWFPRVKLIGYVNEPSDYEENQSENNSNEDNQPNIFINNNFEENTFRKPDNSSNL